MPVFDEQAAGVLQQALASRDASTVAEVVAGMNASGVDPAIVGELADLHLEIDGASFQRVVDGVATVEAVSQSRGGDRSAWLVSLVIEDGKWKIAATQRVS